MRCGLLGRKLGHSYSPQIHAKLGAYSYSLFEKEPEELEDFLKSGDFSGLNVTIPYKKEVIPYLDELSPRARMLGAVNTIVRRDGRLIGHNTDYFGFETMLSDSGISIAGKKALVCGSGGASNTAQAVLREAGAKEVHMRIASPMIKNPCFYGVDMSTHKELLCYSRNLEQARQAIEADSLAFHVRLPVEDLSALFPERMDVTAFDVAVRAGEVNIFHGAHRMTLVV